MAKYIAIYLLILISWISTVWSDEIVIGIDADMSSTQAIGGQAIYRGAKIAVDEINHKGGILGKNLVLEVKDHRGNPRRGIENIHEFSKIKNLVAILGGVQSPVAVNELSALHEHQIIYLGPWAAATNLIDNGYNPNYIFRLSVRDQYAAEVLIKNAKNRSFKKLGLLLPRTAWGRSNYQSLVKTAKNQGIELLIIEWFNWGNKDFSSQIRHLNEAGVEAIIFVGIPIEGAALVNAFYEVPAENRMPIISHWGLASGKFVEMVGIDRLVGMDISVLQTFSFVNPKNANKSSYVFDQYRKKFEVDATIENIPAVTGVAHAYDLVHLLAIAINNAKTIDSINVRDALENINYYEGLMGDFTYPFSSSRHDALSAKDYILSKYNKSGYLIPIDI